MGDLGVLTKNPGTLSVDFFTNLLDMNIEWGHIGDGVYAGMKRGGTHEQVWSASLVDLTFGSNGELRAIAEHYACDDAKQQFANDFARAWAKVMNLDRNLGRRVK